MKPIHTLFVLAALASPAVYGAEPKTATTAGATATVAAPLSEGIIRKVDKSGKKLTIKHGPLVNLDMPAMTMVFKVQDPAMLDQVKAGDKVNFVAEEVNGVLTVTKIEKAN